MKTSSPLVAVAVLFIGLGCGEPEQIEPVDAKGVESPVPELAKDDSFRKPTYHGELSFGLAAQGEVTEEEHFHAWTFTLSGDAQVALHTELVTPNVDTVLYLYRRTPGDALWGSYKKRNDDAEEGVLWSRLSVSLDAAEYRVLVKPYKRSIRGTFALHGACEGDGCPATGDDGTPAVLPAETSFTTSCATQLTQLVNSPAVAKSELTVEYETDRPALPAQLRRAADYYKSYWDELGWGWDEYADEETGVHLLDTEVIDLSPAGALVTVGFSYGDEVTVTFALDAGGAPIAYYHSEQSPRVGWFCGQAGEDLPPEPDEWCLGGYLRHAPRSADAVEDLDLAMTVGEAAGASADDLSPLIAQAVAAYAAAAGLAGSDSITIHAELWGSIDWGAGARVQVRSETMEPVTYELGDSNYDSNWLFVTTPAGAAPEFTCSEGP